MHTENKRLAVIDLGSNTIHLSVYERQDGRIEPIFNTKETVGLINYTRKGTLLPDGVLRISETIGSFRKTAQTIGATSLDCFATAGLRAIRNADEVIALVEKDTGVHIRVISGEEEARLDFLGVMRPESVGEGLVVDMGGGSTEIIRYQCDALQNSLSLPFGSLFLYKRYVSKILPSGPEAKKIKKFVSRQFLALEWLHTAEHICLIGGTARAIGRLHRELFGREAESLQGYTFETGELLDLLSQLSLKKKSTIRDVLRVAPERIHTIMPGLIAFSELAKAAECSLFSISKKGVREGFIKAYLSDD